jgi:hypothetical protein
MTKSAFLQAERFIYRDIRREIRLGYVSQKQEGKETLKHLGVPSGGGNFLAALGLLCYTEFLGKLKYGCKHASENFNRFFDDLGPDYKKFRDSRVNVYDIFRCGLAHEYYAKQNCDIYMAKKPWSVIGVGKRTDGRFWFVVEQYFQDFKRALDTFQKAKF